jgi:hypothetical protein
VGRGTRIAQGKTSPRLGRCVGGYMYVWARVAKSKIDWECLRVYGTPHWSLPVQSSELEVLNFKLSVVAAGGERGVQVEVCRTSKLEVEV